MLSELNVSRLALGLLPGFGARRVAATFAQLSVKHCSNALEALRRFAPASAEGDLHAALQQARTVLERSGALGAYVIPLDDQRYPHTLREAADAPPFLHVLGTLPSSWSRAIAIIGTRDPDPSARAATEEIVAALSSEPGCIVVSGLALGCDTAAHEGAISHGVLTVAVVGGGLDVVYPKSNSALAKAIIEAGGALVSEHAVGTAITKYNLIARDRIQSGLSAATVVVQTSASGGSMHTAAFALRQARTLIVLDALGTGDEWSGNRFLLANEDRNAEIEARFKRFPRPYGVRMRRSSIQRFVTAAARRGFVRKLRPEPRSLSLFPPAQPDE